MSAYLTPSDRRGFIGGSDARIIMGDDEEALLRLWREKRGEEEPEDLSGNLIVQLGIVTEDLNRHWYERNTGQAVTRGAALCAASGATAGWPPPSTGWSRRSGAVFEAKFMLPWSFSEEAAAEKHMAQLQHNMWVVNARDGGAVDHHRRRQVGRDDHPGRPPLPAPADHGGEEVLALCARPGSRLGCSGSSHPGRGSRRFGWST